MDWETQAVSAGQKWTKLGWVLGILPALLLLFSSTAKLIQPAGMEESLEPLGWKMSQMPGLGILEAAVAIIYLIPPTRILGAILITGYIGGAIATHVRIGDFFIIAHIMIGVLVWLGVWLRDPRLRPLMPITN